MSSHRGLKLDGAIGQGEICNSLKSENFSKSIKDLWGTKVMCCYVVKSPVFILQRGNFQKNQEFSQK